MENNGNHTCGSELWRYAVIIHNSLAQLAQKSFNPNWGQLDSDGTIDLPENITVEGCSCTGAATAASASARFTASKLWHCIYGKFNFL